MKGNIKLKAARTIKGISQAKMAELLEMTPIAYNNLEMQKIKGKVATWQKIQIILDIPDNNMWEIITYNSNENDIKGGK